MIQTNVEVLKDERDEILNENIRWFNNISLETETMAKLISELLLIAQVTIKNAMKKEVFDLSLCAEIQDLMYDVVADHQIHLKGNLQGGIC